MSDRQQPARAPMTAARLAEIRARAEAATPGPWEVEDHSASDIDDMPSVNMSNGRWWRTDMDDYTTYPFTGSIEQRRWAAAAAVRPDAAFIAASRQDVPDLLAFAEAADAGWQAALPILRAVADAETLYEAVDLPMPSGRRVPGFSAVIPLPVRDWAEKLLAGTSTDKPNAAGGSEQG